VGDSARTALSHPSLTHATGNKRATCKSRHARYPERKRAARRAANPTTSFPLKYFVYCRKSSEDKDRQVQSIDTQKRELARLFGAAEGCEVVAILEESQSAMTPGRPVFDEMLARIGAGEAEGIIAWAPNRLARNAVDASRVIHALDTGVLKDIRFATFTFENTPAGKFMLGIMFNESKYYSDALSERIRLSIRKKLEDGWMPSMAKVGYLNDKNSSTIQPDPDRFALVRELWELMLTGAYSVRRIRDVMSDRGLRTLGRKREGGRPLSLSAVYKLLTSPFYAGLIPWKGKLYAGKHHPMITMDEFERVQELLGRPTQARAKRREFAFTGIFRCGECGFAVTAEEKTNRFGSKYTYYHCSKRRLDYRCGQRSLERQKLEEQIEAFLLTLRIAPELHDYARAMVRAEGDERAKLAETESRSVAEALAKNAVSTRNLTRLRIAEQIGESEFEEERKRLDLERFRLESRQKEGSAAERFEPGWLCVEFSIRAAEWFRACDREAKRLILEIAGSNPLLLDQKAKIDASKLFRKWKKIDSIPTLRAVVHDVRTLSRTDEEIDTAFELLVELFGKLELLPQRP
jgi:site-specific DNA recombinase